MHLVIESVSLTSQREGMDVALGASVGSNGIQLCNLREPSRRQRCMMLRNASGVYRYAL